LASSPDVAVVGGGIVGCAVAAFFAEAGVSVLLIERDEIGAAASGRNSGLLQHPMESALVPLFDESLEHYRALEGFDLPDEPAGVLVLGDDEAGLGVELAALREFPELRAEALAPGEPAALEPSLAARLAGVRLQTGYPVGPATATQAFAARARAAGARVEVGAEAVLTADELTELGTGASGAHATPRLTVGGVSRPAGVVVIAAGPWTPAVIDPWGAWRPISPLWGVVAEVRLEVPPRHAVEEAGIDQLVARGGDPPPLFSLVTARGVSALGSTFLPERPDADALVPSLRERGARFVPALAETPASAVRACARPLSADGLPLLGRAPGRDDVFVAAGHGPWGVSLGPASARMVADFVLGRVPEPPSAFDPGRF
jgi:glycine/D-amino acid oxidase-like deaminating enzyme